MSEQKHAIHNQGCQIEGIAGLCAPDGQKETERLPFRRRVRLLPRRCLSLRSRRTLKRFITHLIEWRRGTDRKAGASPDPSGRTPQSGLKTGDWVRVRSKEEIQATLNPWGELKGCGFMTEMWQYCGTTQRVLKPVQRFVDERNYQVRKSRGVVLLEGVMCSGTEFYGTCDRSCFLFWREEWLEKVNVQDQPENPATETQMLPMESDLCMRCSTP